MGPECLGLVDVYREGYENPLLRTAKATGREEKIRGEDSRVVIRRISEKNGRN